MLIARWHIGAGFVGVGVGVGVGVLAGTRSASAQTTVEWQRQRPGDRPPSTFELEPHLLAAPFDPPGNGTGAGFGAGARASYEIVPDGFLPTIDDSVAFGVGADFLHYQGSGIVAPGACTRFAPGPGGTNVCVEVSQKGGPSNYAFLPLTMQWNFWLTTRWSVFGEPGLALYWYDYRSLGVSPALFLGGRYRIADWLAITLRLGYPTLSVGASFFL